MDGTAPRDTMVVPYHPIVNHQGNTIFHGYGEDANLAIEIKTPSWIRAHFDKEATKIGLKCATDVIDEL